MSETIEVTEFLKSAKEEIAALDLMLAEKTAYLKALEKERADLEEKNEISRISLSDIKKENPDRHDSKLFKSDLSITNVHVETTLKNEETKEKKEELDQQDFMKRNKQLGPEARYYSSLTIDEKKRVADVLSSDFEPQFTYTDEETEKLNEIHRKLNDIVPESEWSLKTSVFCHTPVSGWTTPISNDPTLPSSNFGVEAYLVGFNYNDSPALNLEEELTQLRNLEEKIESLSQKKEHEIEIQHEGLQKLLEEAKNHSKR